MKKIQYTTPMLHTQQLGTADGLLLSASDEKGSILSSGGGTNENGVTDSDVKLGDSYNVWDDDWSK